MRDSKLALEAAQTELRYVAPKAVRVLSEMLDDPDVGPTIKTRLLEIAIKHSGISLASTTVTLDGSVTVIEDSGARERLLASLDRLADAQTRALPAASDDVVEAEVVEDSDAA